MRYIIIIAIIILSSLNAYSKDITFELNTESIQYVAISPPVLGEYQVVIQLFGPAILKLKQIACTNKDSTINFIIANETIASQKIASTFDSGMIGIGRWNSLHEAISQAEYILSRMNDL